MNLGPAVAYQVACCERYDSYQRYELPSFRSRIGWRRPQVGELLPADFSGAYTGGVAFLGAMLCVPCPYAWLTVCVSMLMD